MILINDSKIIASIVGTHAGETFNDIFNRKNNDITKNGKTIWLVLSSQVSPGIIQKFIGNEKEIYCYFLFSDYTSDTKTKNYANSYSNDYENWKLIKDNFGDIKVSGKLSYQTSGLVFDKIEILTDSVLDLWQYKDFLDGFRSSIIFQGGSTFCAEKRENIKDTMKSRYRKVMGRARFVEPYCVFLK